MSKKDIINPSGFKGAGFEQKGMEERNLQVLLKSLSNKTTQKSIESLAKIDKSDWAAIAVTAVSLKNIVESGGLDTMFGNIVNNIVESISLKVEELMAPITNEITTAMNNILDPFILELMPVINNLSAFLAENMVGVGIGGIAGSFLQWLPGGPLWVVLGAALGGYIEQSVGRLMAGETGVDVWTNFADAVFDRILDLTDNFGAGDQTRYPHTYLKILDIERDL